MKGTLLKGFLTPVLLSLFLFGAHTARAETMRLTLEEAIALGIQNSTTLKAKAVSIYSAKAGVKSAQASYYPSVTTTATYTHLFDQPKTPDMEIDLGGPTPVSIPGSYAAASDPISLSVDVKQTIFTFGKINNAVKLAEKNVELSELDLEEEKRYLIVQISKAFYGYILAKEVLKVQQETLARKQDALDVAKKRFNAGLSPEYEVLSAESDVENFKPLVISANNQLRFTLLAVMDLLGIEGDGDFDIELIGSLEPKYYEFEKAMLIKDAMTKKYEIQQFETNISLMRTQQEITKAAHTPVIGAFANYTLKSGFDTSTGENKYWGEDSWEGDLIMGLSISWPLSSLFPWSKENADIKKGELDLEGLDLQFRSIKSGIRLNIENLLLKIEEEWAKINSGKKGIELAQKLYDSSLERYKNGLMSSMDLQDTQLGLNNAKLGYLQAVYNHKIALFDLMDAVGVDHF